MPNISEIIEEIKNKIKLGKKQVKNSEIEAEDEFSFTLDMKKPLLNQMKI